MRYVSVFSGVEAATLAFAPLGWEAVCFCEVDDFPSAVLKYRYPRVPNLGDITKVRWKEVLREWGPVDLVVGGSPCQSFSIAGDRTGLDGASGLMWEYVRTVRELMPRWLLWENVPGALSSSHGEDFRCLLESLDALGYGLAWRVLDAQFFGVAQRRERVFLVGRLGDVDGPCEVLFEPESLRWDTPSSREKRKELAAGAGGRAEAAGFKYHQGSGAGNVGYEPEQSPTLTADYHNPAVLNLQGSQVDREPKNGPGGKGWCDPDENGAYTLNATDRHVVCMTDTQPNCMVSDEVCGCLSQTMHKDPPVAFAVRTKQTGANGSGVQRDVAHTCDASGPEAVSSGYTVRRLTPRECERLQGMPDDWTRVPYKGKPAEECPDTPRYKAIGNSMAVNVMKWLGARIDAIDKGSDPSEACSALRGEIFGV